MPQDPPPPAGLTVDNVLITDELGRRPAHAVDIVAENHALHALAARAADPPEAMLATLVKAGLELCQAGTAGISLLERAPDGREVFRWAALAGRMEQHVGGTTPRDWSPCGTCLDRHRPQLYRDPARYFTYLAAVPEPIVEALVIPFTVAGEPLGTIWIVSHEPTRRFDAEDVRVMTALANFTASTVRTAIAERDLRISVERLQQGIELAPTLIVGIDEAGRIALFNRACEELTGYTRDEILQRELMPLLVPASWHSIVAAQLQPEHLEAGARPSRSPWLTRSGDERLIEWRWFRESRMTIGLGFDVTAQVLADEERSRLTSIVESSDDAIIGKTLEGVVTSWNPGAERTYGFSAEEMVGRPISMLVPPGHRPELLEMMGRLARGECIRDYETIRRRKDGQTIHVSLSISPIRDGRGTLVGASTIARNISERKRVEARIVAQHAITRLLIEAESTTDMGVAVLEATSAALGWDLAELWLVDEPAEQLRCSARFARPDTRPFQATTPDATFRAGVGLPGLVWQQMKPEWIADVATDERFLRRDAAVAAGLRSALAFPIRAGARTLGVIAAFTARRCEGNDGDMQLMETVGNQVGLFLERRRAEAEIRHREEVFRSLSSCSPVGIILTDAEGGNTYSNRKCQETLGLSAEQIHGDGWLQLLSPDDRTHVLEGWHACVRDGREFEREIRIHRMDGSVRWIHGRAAPVRSETGRLFGYVGTVEDVTERRRAHENAAAEKSVLELIARGEPLGAVLDALLRTLEEEQSGVIASVLLVNEEGTHLVFAAGPSLPAEWVRAITPLAIGPSASACGRAAYQRQPVIIADITTDPLCADVRDLAIRAGLCACWSIPLLGGQNHPLGTFAVYHRAPRAPTTEELGFFAGRARLAELAIERHARQEERGRLVARVEAARAEAERANGAKNQFLSVLSHELRTPLNAIVGWAAVLSRGPLDAEKMAVATGSIRRSAQTLTRLVSDLLDVSRIDAGKLEITWTVVDLAAVTQSAIESARFLAAARDVACELARPSEPVLVFGDAEKLQQVVANLLNNAVKFSASGARVTVRVETTEMHARVVVSDAGEGISPDFLPRIFERFTQDAALTPMAHGGLGLGLAIARHIVELHGGTVSAASPGRGLGATFSVTVPRLSGAHSGEPTLAPTVLEDAPSLSLRGARVLLVEDEADTREMLAMVARERGAVVEAVSSARAALEAVAAFDPDLIISDIKMANMDGYQLIRELRRRARHVPAVAVTAFAGAEDRQAARAAGFELHLAKPVDPGALLTAAARLLPRGA